MAAMEEGRGGDDDEMPPRRNPWGVLFPVVLGGEWGNEREREERGVSLKRPPLAQPMQQPTKKTASTKGGVFFTRFGHGGTLGEDN